MACRVNVVIGLFLLAIAPLTSQALDQWVNEHRESLGLTTLYIEPSLQDTAENYLDELIARGALSHMSINGEGLMDRYRRYGGTAWSVGEILGTQSSTEDPKRLIELWIDSPEHKSVLEGQQWSAMGFAIQEINQSWVAVVLFSNSVIQRKEGRTLYFFPYTESLFLQSYPRGEEWTCQTESLNLNQLNVSGPLLLEIRDSGGQLRNRLFTP